MARKRLRPLPAALALGVPTRLRTREAFGLLGARGAARAAVDLVAPRPPGRSALPDRAIGPLVADKLGRRVVDVLVDPLVGGIHAGRVRDLSAAAVFPTLLEAAQRRGSLMRALKAASSGNGAEGPAFLTLRSGLGSLPAALVEVLEGRGAAIQTGSPVTTIAPGAPGEPRWRVETATQTHAADAVVLATPPAATAALLEPLDAGAAGLVRGIDAASVAVVTLRYRVDDLALPETGTGILVPATAVGPNGPYLVTAVTFLDRKWPHLAKEGEVLLRASMGRIDDRRHLELDDVAIVARTAEELVPLVSAAGDPIEAAVVRWPDAFPQYRVNHLVRVDGIESAAAALGGVAVAGAAYRGVGVPACIGSGRAAARAVRAVLLGQS